jgi:STE24 endopeptidase
MMMSDATTNLVPALTLAFVGLVLVQALVRLWLLSRQVRHVKAARVAVPAEFSGRVDLSAHQKAADYTSAKARLDVWAVAVEAAVLLSWTLLGGLDLLNTALRAWLYDPAPSTSSALVYQVCLLLGITLVSGLIDVPFDLMRHFGVEQRFGFNRMRLGDYVRDAVKGAVLSLVVMTPLMAAVLWLMGQAGSYWWLWAFAVLAGFQLLMMIVFPTWIAPLFNRFTPLQDSALEDRIRQLMERCGFSARDLLVMDGSRRSAHANAYFTGLGRAKRVVFFDTLLKALTPSEVEAVLAHELGHFRHRHVTQRLVMVMAASLGGLALLGAASQWSGFYVGLGVHPNLLAPNDGLALALFSLTLPAALFLLTPIGAWWSRRQEYEADAFAASLADRRALASALVKLYTDNASTLTPDPWYVRFHYSHPPALQRLGALQAFNAAE